MVLYQRGRPEEARPASREARKIGAREPLLPYHAGMIERAAGDAEVGCLRLQMLQPALQGRDHGLRAVVDSQPFQNHADV